MSFRHAIELLKDESSLAATACLSKGEPVKRTTVRTLPAPVALNVDQAYEMLAVGEAIREELTRAGYAPR